MDNRPTICILSGGKSQRMGADKAKLPWDGSTLLEYVARSAAATGSEVLIVGRTRPANWSLPQVAFLEDEQPDRGPLGGLITSLKVTNRDLLALACDLPQLKTSAIDWLIAEAKQRDIVDGLVVRNNSRIEPLFSIYRQTCLPLAEERMRANRRSMHGLIESGHFESVDAPDWVCHALTNVNTPDDYEQVSRARYGQPHARGED